MFTLGETAQLAQVTQSREQAQVQLTAAQQAAEVTRNVEAQAQRLSEL
jgi:hypothetical protein